MMGLDTTHDCWHGAYSSFMDWRSKICEIAGYGYIGSREGFGGKLPWPKDDPLSLLLAHSDCDGEIKWEDCQAIANRLKELLPLLLWPHSGSVLLNYNAERTNTFINGLELAASKKENVGFH
jgi:hypothetical protein